MDDSVSMATGSCVTTLFLTKNGCTNECLVGGAGRSGLELVEVFCLNAAGLFNWNVTYVYNN